MQDPRSKNLQFGKEEEEEEEEPPDHEGDEEDEEDEEHADKAPSTTPDFEQRMRLVRYKFFLDSTIHTDVQPLIAHQ